MAEEKVFVNASFFKAAQTGISAEDSTNVYDEWASAGSYDQDMNDERYRGASAAVQTVADLFPSNRGDVLILDAACGTGLVAEKLQKLGFSKIDGFDASSKMLESSRTKNVYQKLTECFLDASPLPMSPASYDCAVIAGGMCEGHIPTAGLRSLARVIKSGGVVVIVMRESFLRDVAEYKDRLEKEMETMEKEGLWRLLAKDPLPNYFHHHMGVVFSFRLC